MNFSSEHCTSIRRRTFLSLCQNLTVRSPIQVIQLEALNVFDTRITPAAFPAIASLPRLAHCYAVQTAIPTGTAVPQALAGKIVF
jgi:hypothetical protein